jgi:hypothetical protein
LRALLSLVLALGLVLLPWPAPGIPGWPNEGPVQAAPGLCVGPICADEISRSSQFPWQLRLRLSDQRAHRERVVVDCRDGGISPFTGPVERGFAGAVVRRACRLAAEPAGEPAQEPAA